VAAILPALLLPAGVVMLIGGLVGLAGHLGPALALVLLGLFGIGIGSLCLRIIWTGHVPASLEEYGLDDSSEVLQSRDEARAAGRLLD
jgi:hypothetical protein